ncbi:MAG: diguanylate cyclase [Proteobacteria bacterium]|nr:diguanylate cyclase [Pseudomonadota bacterium]
MPTGGIREKKAKSMALAEASLERMRALGQPADPQSYTFWLAVADSDNGLLRQQLGERITPSGSVSARDLRELYEAHVGPRDVSGQVDGLSEQVAAQLAEVARALDAASEIAAQNANRLAQVSEDLTAGGDATAIPDALGTLTGLAAATQSQCAGLGAQLDAAMRQVAALRQALQQTRRESLVDPLTSLFNRQYAEQACRDLLARCRARAEPLSLLRVDVDNLEHVNKAFGAVIGDRVLRFVAMTIERGIQGQDVAARFDGDEFAVLLPATRLSAAVRVAQQIRSAVMNKDLLTHLTNGQQRPLTVSVGVATLQREGAVEALIEAAAFCLAAAKRCGRNQVVAECDNELFDALAGGAKSA